MACGQEFSRIASFRVTASEGDIVRAQPIIRPCVFLNGDVRTQIFIGEPDFVYRTNCEHDDIPSPTSLMHEFRSKESVLGPHNVWIFLPTISSAQ
mmetsp:Transcript_12357/g.26523  ORF Transcript_12357/g.26523 Transcript_12357/m.26523 type:complete len:95 (+) Transcript_12357:444-728(+)